MKYYPYILVAFLEGWPLGHTFERWPHHITILPWFKADKSALAGLDVITAKHLPVRAEIGGQAMFGARNDILVRLVESDDLNGLHQAILTQHAGLLGLASSRFTGENFRPHVTLQAEPNPAPGPITVKQISLVEATGPRQTKQIIRIIS